MSFLGKHAIVNNAVVLSNEATVSITNKSYFYSYSVYESIKVLNGKGVFLKEHLERLFFSANGIDIRHSFTLEQIENSFYKLLKVDSIKEATVTITLIGGVESSYFITAANRLKYPLSFYESGINAITYHAERFLPRYKTNNLLLNYMGLKEASSKGAFEALLVNKENLVLEGSRSNLFALKNKEVFTSDEDKVLAGVTRDKVIKVIEQLGYTLNLEAPSLKKIKENYYDALFISSTSMGAMPIGKIDEKKCNTKIQFVKDIGALVKQLEQRELH